MNGRWQMIGMISIVILFILNAIVTMGNTAILNLNESAIRKKVEEKDKKSAQILKWMEQPNYFLYTIEWVTNGSLILIGFLYKIWVYPLIKESIKSGLLFFAVIVFIVLIGNVLPKRYALKYSDQIAYKTISIIECLIRLFYPITMFINLFTKLILSLFKINLEELEENVTEDEIMSMVNEGHEQGVLEASKVEMISNIIEFDEKEVKDVMTHRKKIVALNANMNVEQALTFMLNEGYSRYPLYEENIDNIIGIVHVKDVARYYVINKQHEKSIQDFSRESYFIPDTQNINVLFHDMQSKKIHMAVSIDEYGQTAGIISMEDILEEIVGNILDEYDIDEKMIIEQGENRYLIKGLANLQEVAQRLGFENQQDDFDTLNGLLTSILGRIPFDGEKVIISYKGYFFHIIDVKNRMIRYVKVSKEGFDS